MAWIDYAACRGLDPELWFPVADASTPQGRADAAPALAVCRGCPVRRRCLEWALRTGQDVGIWGGCTEAERRAIRRGALTPPGLVSAR